MNMNERVKKAFLIAPAIPVFILALSIWHDGTIVLLFGLPIAYSAMIFAGFPTFLLMRRLGLLGWSHCIVGGAFSALPVVVLYLLTSNGTHLEIYGVNNSALLMAMGSTAGYCFWFMGLRGDNAVIPTRSKSLAGGLLAIILVVAAGGFWALGREKILHGSMNVIASESMNSQSRAFKVRLSSGEEVIATAPENFPHREGCPVYISSRKSYETLKPVYWVIGYEDAPLAGNLAFAESLGLQAPKESCR